MSKDTGGPAFPCEVPTGAVAPDANGINRYITEPYQGMTLRDYFAAQAIPYAMHELFYECDTDQAAEEMNDSVAYVCYLLADAMLKERNK